MEREPQLPYARLKNAVGEYLPYTSFYRFLHWLEQTHPQSPPLGSTSLIEQDLVRLRPHPGMGFPVSELKGIEAYPDENSSALPTVRTTFLGLYGVDSPLPTGYIDDIAQQRDGHLALEHFLDIFNHRILTQFYRIWRKHAYPATFTTGGSDKISQSILGWAGLGIPGCAEHITMPLARFLALPGIIRQPSRTAEGICALVKLLATNTQTTVQRHVKRRMTTAASSISPGITLAERPVIGSYGWDINSMVEIQLATEDKQEARQWLPPGSTLLHDLLGMLRVYLGWRLDARITLTLPLRLLPAVRITSQQGEESICIGYNGILGHDPERPNPKLPRRVTILLGEYQGLRSNPMPRKVVEINE